ncbi:MAG: isopenicillin N synthase family oxygenase [Amylibacter sp.]|nr:isopenicillin N synthase family oxygenase [Amylibacter sp.]MDA8811808.1 isopenicillin N synthase family oxygenase [Amylibacter sp.]MDB2600915.1 isopenicillin N synthase family oxygenase [Amylibacter sp.]
MAEFEILAIGLDEVDAPAKFAKSFRETGFAIIKDHNISSDEIDRMYGVWTDFFASDEGPNFAVKPGESAGYFGYKSENAKGSANKDLKEFFHAYQNKTLPNITEKETREFQQKLIKMGSTLLGWLDQESEGHVSFSEPLENMINGSDMNLLRIIHYPPLPDNVEPGEVRAAAHEDINLITLLVTGTEPGLQAKDVNGNWHDVPCKPGYITVNSGDMLSMASKGHYPSTPHRVVNPPKQENRSRYSMPLFVHPRPDVLLDKLTAGEFLDERLKEIGLK